MLGRQSWAKFLTGLLIGAATGCTTALLFAPRPGRQIRNTLTKEARRWAAKAYGSCGDLYALQNVMAVKAAKNIVENIGSIRSAGL